MAERNEPETKEGRGGAKSEGPSGASPAAAAAPPAGEAAKSPPKPPSPAAFSRKGIIILGAVVVLEGVAFLGFIARSGKGAAPAEPRDEEESATATQEQDLEKFFQTGRMIMDIGEVKVPVTSTQPRAPRSMSASFQVVITKELGEKLSGGGGGHGGGGKATPQQKVLELNVRSILREMMDSEGIRLLEPSAKNDFRRKAKDRLNHV